MGERSPVVQWHLFYHFVWWVSQKDQKRLAVFTMSLGNWRTVPLLFFRPFGLAICICRPLLGLVKQG